ncbi:hypothetical protein CC1G_00482 [Coprinopsis cinerea okayama7|uniref:Large ribosomal subunit protein mL40 n=1 Tax=Coprinopsis cinerea (strain Okayama-7 / 130 / ATCC MYA-4618 / FGSC 9003) TaxID=240176 RepID=A8N358_COPC7|nr:hypothetical protein CC1G_00482 [Coprinopsis cinerea okayama7\|eukprot:XP_001829303.1 hypothetical protein CC1G_00482 [Coprinopsis cinerea okayama7\
MSLLTTLRARLPSSACSTVSTVRTYAAKASEQGDPKKDIIRRVLYPANVKNRPSPVGTWRPDVARALQRAIPSVQAHNTIERAWLLHKRQLRKKRDAELARKFARMKEAMDELYHLDTRLYMEANKADDPRARSQAEMAMAKTLSVADYKVLDGRIRGLFPRELKIPTDTPSREGWNYEYTPFHRPL